MIGTVLRPEASSPATIKTSAIYNSTHSKLVSTTDERGTVTAYTYNADGSVKSVTLDDVETEYLYGKKGRQSQIMMDTLSSVMYFYDKGNLSQIVTGIGTSSWMMYYLTYDAFGRTLSVRAENALLASYTYEAKTGYLKTMTYGNGYALRYVYDILGRTTHVYHTEPGGTEELRFTYEYDGSGNLYRFIDCETHTVYLTEYNSAGNIVSEEQRSSETGAFLQGQYYTYNSYGDLATSTLQIPGQDTIRYVCSYDYETSDDGTGKLTKWEAKGADHTVSYVYDELNRIWKQQYTAKNASAPNLTKNYSYVTDEDNNTSSLVSSVTYSGYSTRSYSYTYDAVGNITSITQGANVIASYEYDDLGQLTRENNMNANKTYVYTYDDRGNMTSRKTYAYTTETLGTLQSTDTYSYYQQYDTEMWGDVLKSYNGTTFSYDTIGNPLTYYNGANYTFEWIQGRTLISGTKGSTSFQYQYNTDGLRTRKIVGSTTYDYYWNGSQLAMMTITSGTTVKTLKFYYDAEGVPFYLDYNGTEYFYITNLQGDVVGLSTSSGIVAYYEYDAWGRITSYSGLGSTDYSAIIDNPLRYRGYIYDTETGFYYLQSRYYDPAIRRFINADSYVSTGTGLLGYNMFAYCNNNPVISVDSTGKFAISVGVVLFVGGSTIISGLANMVVAACTDGDMTEAFIEGAATGFVASTTAVVAPSLLPTSLGAVGKTFLTVTIAGIGGMAVDYVVQRASFSLRHESNEGFQIDKKRIVKAGLFTGISAAVPFFANDVKKVADAIGALFVGMDATLLNAVIDILLNVIDWE